MKHSWKINVMAFAVASVVAVAGSTALAAKGGNGGGKKPPVETSNNLSYPALFYQTAKQSGTIGTYSLGASFPTGMSYGCAAPETIGTTTYPNTSCVVDGASVVTPLSYDDCAATKCSGQTIERIYWQKNTANKWQAGYATSLVDPLPVDYVDWGDNLESRSWPVQVIRVETNTFAELTTATTRFDMWHVFGQGTNELWGVRATDPGAKPYAFSAWPFAVNVSDGVRLNIAKLANGSAICPIAPLTSPLYNPTWDSANDKWSPSWVLYDAPYTAELNIKGSYVYGYNWNLRSAVVPGEVNKAGWWRLTFYTNDGSILFDDADVPKAPPTTDLVPQPLAAAEEEGDTGPLYVPVVDTTNNLTYIDICITSTKGGGSKKPQ
jgi:hypothetical protein